MLAASAVVVVGLGGAVSNPAAAANWRGDYLPNLSVLDQNGKELKFYDDVIKDRIVVVSFIYTTCRDMCPLITARLAQMREQLDPAIAEKVRFVSVSVDPANDTPERLKQFADALKLEGDWLLLTGKRRDIDAIRHKLGERSGKLSEHRLEVLLGNDATGEWERASALGDLGNLAMAVRAMDPEVRKKVELATAGPNDDAAAAQIGMGLPGHALFIKACAACHTIGKGEKVGPDLAGLTERRDQAWAVKYITAPNKVRAAKDPTALELRERFKAIRMPNLGISEAEAMDLIDYLERKSATR
jgi:protein SCO1/2